ncbi:MAG: cation:proton antiporter, partial [Armatimonadetes bacterium]|nr:cation:proton antiporter [Armatimonadota bacterium]
MPGLSEEQLLHALLAVAVILIVGRGAAEIARRLNQPEVLGELIGGFFLGPSALGLLFPSVFRALFHDEGVAVALSMLSWVGAILLLLIAGMEADLGILREKIRPGTFAALFAIVPSLIAGTLFAQSVLDRPLSSALFLGIVLSVTAVSISAKILIERDALRRSYAQVILAAGIASEVLVWLLISVVAALRTAHPVLGVGRSLLFAVLFFAFMLTLGRRFTFWAMRRIADMTQIVKGQLSLVLVLAFLSAGITSALGLHALLGAFVFGVLLRPAPRASTQLKGDIEALTVSLFAPAFFVLAGMRVDIFKLGSWSSVGIVLVLFTVATVVKVGFVALGAKLGGLPGWESLLVGLGVNLKGGTDVIVAILGAELGFLYDQTYTLYAVVAILTELVSPPLMALLEKRVPPSPEERARLNQEEARRRAYLPGIERILVQVLPQLYPAQAAGVGGLVARLLHIDEFAAL